MGQEESYASMIWSTIPSYVLEIANWLYLYTVVLLGVLFYYEATKIPYKPAYKRNLLEQAWNITTKSLSGIINNLDAWLNPGSLSEIEMRRYRQQLSSAKKYVPMRPRRPMAIAMAAIAFAASKSIHDHDVFFDTDSGILGIDNRCTACISNYLDDFETSPNETTAAIKGFGGTKTHGARKGTIIL
jgi:hypothetical protein